MNRSRESKFLIRWSAWGLLVLSCVFTVTGFWGQSSFLFDLTSHFRLQYLLVEVAGLVVLLMCRKWHYGLLVTGFALTNLWQIVPFYTAPSPVPAEKLAGEMKILHINVWFFNHNYAQVAELIEQENPDVLSLNEYRPHWEEGLAKTGVLKRFLYEKVVSEEIGLYSRVPLTFAQPDLVRQIHGPAIVATAKIAGRPITLVSTHTKTPVKPGNYRHQLKQIESLIQIRPQLGDHLVIIGDLNMTPWAYPYNRLVSQTELRNSALGLGVQPSWPTLLVLPWLPIDHVLVSEDIAVLERRVGPAIGSDHLPVIVTLGLTR